MRVGDRYSVQEENGKEKTAGRLQSECERRILQSKHGVGCQESRTWIEQACAR